MEKKKYEKIVISIILIIQTIIFGIVGANKSYIHMDEAYSLGLASYDKVEIQDNEDFYNTWHDGKYYEDYLCVNDDEIGQYKQVYENQKNDVHPPLYYLILRFAMGFHKNSYSKWPGIIINMIIYAFVTIFMYLILNKILKDKYKYKEKSAIIAMVSSLVLASITNVIYIRMYALSTLNVLITTYLHLILLEKKEIDYKLLTFIGVSALAGSLTHYYYLFYLAMIFIMFAIKYIKEKRYKELIAYTVTMCIAGAISLIIFPYSIKHLFFGYRGQGALSKLTQISEFLKSIALYIQKFNRHAFNGLLFILLALIVGLGIYKKVNKKKIFENKNQYIKYITIPTAFYTLLVSLSAPWIELRYIMPVCGLVFILIIYLLENVLENIFNEKNVFRILTVCLAIILITPIIFKMEPEEEFLDKRDIVEEVQNELNVPTIYMFNSNENRFLDDILLFSKLDNSYIAKDVECTDENINKILNGKDLSNGILVFINGGQNNDEMMEKIKNATGLNEWKWIKGLNACNIYLVK
mgnify:FL=1